MGALPPAVEWLQSFRGYPARVRRGRMGDSSTHLQAQLHMLGNSSPQCRRLCLDRTFPGVGGEAALLDISDPVLLSTFVDLDNVSCCRLPYC